MKEYIKKKLLDEIMPVEGDADLVSQGACVLATMVVTGLVTLTPEGVRKLAEIANYPGVKESVINIDPEDKEYEEMGQEIVNLIYPGTFNTLSVVE